MLKCGRETKISSQLTRLFYSPFSFHLQHRQKKKMSKIKKKKFCHVHLEDQDRDKIKVYFYKRDEKVIEMRTSTLKNNFFHLPNTLIFLFPSTIKKCLECK